MPDGHVRPREDDGSASVVELRTHRGTQGPDRREWITTTAFSGSPLRSSPQPVQDTTVITKKIRGGSPL